MFGLKKSFSLHYVGLLLCMPLWLSSAFADDMEIYNISDDSPSGDVNIVFMLDNSGSMKYCIDSTDNNDCGDTTKTRMYALRSAMAQVLDKLDDTNKVGIFTYGKKVKLNSDGSIGSDVDGGSMLAPLRALNEVLPDGVTTHKQYLLNWFVDSTKTVEADKYKINNYPPNWGYNFGPSTESTIYNDPPGCTTTTGAGCSSNWNTTESNLIPQNNTPLESAYAEIGAYFMGQKASKWGTTYFARTGNLAKISRVTTSTSAYSKTASTLNVTSTSPLQLSGSDYLYRQPNYTSALTCAAPSWHIILVTDGEPNQDDNREMFKQVMGNQSICSSTTEWSCSKEMALFLANKTIEIPEYSWNCTTNCGSYTNSVGTSLTPAKPTSMTLCDTVAENGGTTTTTVSNYKTYNWQCGSNSSTSYSWVRGSTCSPVATTQTCDSTRVNQTRCMSRNAVEGSGTGNRTYTCTANTTTSYQWNCTSSSGGSCSDSSKPTPSSTSCNETSEVGTTAVRYGNAVNTTVTWQCNVQTHAKVYNSGLGVDIKTDAIFVGPDASAEAKQEMTNITDNGGGTFSTAESVDGLVSKLLQSIENIKREPNTVSAPGVAVNQLSRFQHLDQLYYSVFKPAASGVWEGNLKRFVLDNSTVKDAQKDPAVDSATKFFSSTADSCWGEAGSSSTPELAGCIGYTVTDGNDTIKGGMRSKLDVSTRNVLTTTDGTSVATLESLRLPDTATAATITTSAGYMGYSTACASSTAPYCNGDVTALGGTTTSQVTSFNTMIDWGKGVRAIGKVDMLAGDPLHSQPVLVNYGFTGDSGSGTTRQNAFNAALASGYLQENYVFFSTNGGALHAVDAKTGEEKFAFIPKEMLPLIPKTKNVPTWTGTASRIYGLDNTWVAWRRDANGDGDIKDTNEWVNLYGGMRMGGSNYYALDVTSITSPTIEWTIKGPLAGGFSTISDSNGRTAYRPINVATLPSGAYRWMGQTWSKPVLARLALKTGTAGEAGRTVLVFGGGYDPTNETQPYKSGTSTITPVSTFGTDAYGHQLYIVDAKTGDLLFWAGGGSATYGTGTTTVVSESPTLTVTDMKYSIAGTPSPVDRDGDGYTDLIYFGDLGGQVFRVDLKNKGTNNGTPSTCASTITSTCSDLVFRVAKIASLGEAAEATPTIDNQRRFFEAPGIGILQRPGGSQYMGVAIGSGNRSHPAYVGTQDRIYVFEDTTALTSNLASPGTITALTETNLQDVTSYGYDASNLATFTGKNGYYINVTNTSGTGADGEKIFSTPLIFQGLVYLTSYIPETGASTTTSNACSPGTGSSSLYIFNVFDGRAETTDATSLLDRTVEGITSTITGDVQIVFNADGTSTILAGTYAQEAESSNKGLRRTRWYENPHY